ncbi:hypothetical protein GN160_01300 [Blochmannia endosymbiont of Colobopsis nipponica]|uniref:prephenate dehydratase domain-containing protein n=1 Tax=Blochmannia endosymbiont of Colobopsis nipponica TaxID=2681987 RepID=UPI00178748E2|nr:prephenate dehydratase domain-containing protein [Blochmannia endosymbiont of Colobopsis nipponica]QOI11232.1 hypothetical protein GN160_01300 [Blochmannia endosymbiont of Colobopsis nipponica]
MLKKYNKHKTRIAFLGPQGSYSHIAAKKYGIYHFGDIIECSCKKFIDIVQAIRNENAEYGILPIENSTSGPINEVYDILKNNTYISLIGEITLPIQHCMLVNDNKITFKAIKTIYSHPQPLLQCSHFITHFPQWHIVYCKSTSVAMQTVATLKKPTIAAVGSKFGSILYGLQILKFNLANYKHNITRFVVIGYKNKITKF